MAESLWTVRFSSGEQINNLTDGDLKHFVNSGELQPTDMVWREGLKDWVKASRLKGLFPSEPMQARQSTAPPLPSATPSPPAQSGPSTAKPASRDQIQKLTSPGHTSSPRPARSKTSASTQSLKPLDKLAVLNSRWPYRGALLLAMIFICLPWMSFSFYSAAQSFTIGEDKLDMPEVSANRLILGVETDPGIIAFLGGLLAIVISFANRWLPGDWLKLGSGLIAPGLFFGCWLYFFMKLSEHKLAGGLDVQSSIQSVKFSIPVGSWLFLFGTIGLGALAVITRWDRKPRSKILPNIPSAAE